MIRFLTYILLVLLICIAYYFYHILEATSRYYDGLYLYHCRPLDEPAYQNNLTHHDP